jgi:hypothetical protein
MVGRIKEKKMTDQSKRKQVGTQLDADLYRQIKSLAVLRGRMVGELIDDAIRAYLEKQDVPAFTRKKSRTL